VKERSEVERGVKAYSRKRVNRVSSKAGYRAATRGIDKA
jgi:hypothetical protein